MRKKFSVLAIVLMLALSISLAACGDKNKGTGGGSNNNGGGGNTTLTSEQAKITSLAASTDRTALAANINSAMGVNIALPSSGSVSAGAGMVVSGTAVYNINVQNSTVSQSDYVSSISSTMTSAGYTKATEDGDTSFYKVVGGTTLKSLSVVSAESSATAATASYSYMITLSVSAYSSSGGGGNTGGGSTTSTWPATQISAVINGNTIPAYATSAGVIQYAAGHAATSCGVTIFNTTVAEVNAYKALLTSNGFTLNAEVYTKTLAGGAIISIGIESYTQGNGQTADIAIAYTAASGGGGGGTVTPLHKAPSKVALTLNCK